MSHGQAIDLLPLEDFPLESDAQDPGFAEVFSDLVGIAGTDADGFDADVAIANSLLDSLDGALSLMSGQDGGTLDNAFEEILQLDPAEAGQHVIDLATALPGIDTNVDNLGHLLGGATVPAITTYSLKVVFSVSPLGIQETLCVAVHVA